MAKMKRGGKQNYETPQALIAACERRWGRLAIDLAADEANKAFLGYGDLATFLVGLVGGIQIGVSTEYLFGENQTAFRAIVNMDMKRKPSATYTILKTAAA